MRLLPLLGLCAALAPSPASAQTADPSLKAAEDQIPFLSDETLDRLAKRVWGMRDRLEHANNPPMAEPANRTVSIAFTPGFVAPILQTVRGYPTSIAFFDSTGQPWPLHWEMSGNPNQSGSTDCGTSASGASAASAQASAIPGLIVPTGFNVCIPIKGGNVAVITTVSNNPRGGLTVMLEGANMPIQLMLMGGASRFDSNVVANVQKRGPRAKTDLFTRSGAQPVTGAPHLTSMLNGVGPVDARPLGVLGVPADQARAWALGDRYYLLIEGDVVSPQPDAWAHSANGLGIYAIPPTPIVLTSIQGRTVAVQLQER